jgi:hypothetical protein
MHFAKSLRYGGVFVEAKKCDRDSYLKLGLLCPVCNSPVFYVGEQSRAEHFRKTPKGEKTPVKSTFVEAFFSHFEADKNSTLCVARHRPSAAVPTAKESKEAISRFRKQSLQIFKNHFMAMVATSPMMANYTQDITFYEQSLLRESGVPIDVVKRVLKGIQARFSQFYRANLYTVKSSIIEGFKRDHSSHLAEDEIRIQIAIEALDFLATSAASSILKLLFTKACSEEIQSIALLYDKEVKEKGEFNWKEVELRIEDNGGLLERLSQSWNESTISTVVKAKYSYKMEEWFSTFRFSLSYVALIIVSVDWGKAFDLYEEWSEDYEKKLSFFDAVNVDKKKAMPLLKRSLGLYHYTLLTNNVVYQPISLLPDMEKDAILASVGQVKPGSTKVFSVPAQKGYQTRIKVENDFVLIEIYKGKAPSIVSNEQGKLIVAGVLVWNAKGDLTNIKFDCLTATTLFKNFGKAPQKMVEKGSIPMLCVAVCESLDESMSLIWLAAYEYCLGLSLLQIV